jgi:hypothetical protein
MTTKEKEILDLIKQRIPDFSGIESQSDDPMIIIAFLSNFLNDAYQSKNDINIRNYIELINDFSVMDDAYADSLLDEFAIGLYDFSKEAYKDFKGKLSPTAEKKFDNTIIKWNKQGGMAR